MASLPASTVSGGFRSFPIPDSGRGLVTVTRLSDGAMVSAFCPAPAAVAGTAPVITSISPSSAKVGDMVTITGVRLSIAREVDFGTKFIDETPTVLTDTQITCKVPVGAGSNVRVRTDAGNSDYFPFTLSTGSTGQFSLWADVLFTADRAPDFFNDANHTYYTTATDGSWNHGGLDNNSLAAGQDGSLRLYYPGPDGAAGVIGFHDSNARVSHRQMRYSMYVEPTGTLSIFYCAPGGTPVAYSTNLVAQAGYWYALARTTNRVYVQASADGSVFQVILDPSVLPPTSAALYLLADINANAAYHLIQPQFSYKL